VDKIILNGMVFYGFHGMSAAEQELGQRFVVDLEVYLDLSAAGTSDSLDDTVSYTLLYKKVKEIMEGPSRKLLENAAETIARQVLDDSDIDAVRVTIKKPEVPMKGSVLAYAAVEIFRDRKINGLSP
jgi:dihydroneopterin aldolase